eukprot:966103-Amphidinium_carterae.1
MGVKVGNMTTAEVACCTGTQRRASFIAGFAFAFVFAFSFAFPAPEVCAFVVQNDRQRYDACFGMAFLATQLS